jgi:hypothetical protein
MKYLTMLMSLVGTHIRPVIQQMLSADFQQFVWAGHYKSKMKQHYFPNELLMRQYFHLPLCGPLPGCFSHHPVCSLTPPRNVNSCDPCHNTIYYSLVVK